MSVKLNKGTVYNIGGNRTRPYVAKKYEGEEKDEVTGKYKKKYKILGYFATKEEAQEALDKDKYNTVANLAYERTLEDAYKAFSDIHLVETLISRSSINAYNAAYKVLEPLYKQKLKALKPFDFEKVIAQSRKSYPTLRKVKVCIGQIYQTAIKNGWVDTDYSKLINISRYKHVNPNAINRTIFSRNELNTLWKKSDNKYVQMVLIMIYTGVRVSELLNLTKENVNLEKQYFLITKSKTEAGKRIVPITDCIVPFFDCWIKSSRIEYVFYGVHHKKLIYGTFKNQIFGDIMRINNMKHLPHDTRHTCVSLLSMIDIPRERITLIIGHAFNKTATDNYMHLDNTKLLNDVNKIPTKF